RSPTPAWHRSTPVSPPRSPTSSSSSWTRAAPRGTPGTRSSSRTRSPSSALDDSRTLPPGGGGGAEGAGGGRAVGTTGRVVLLGHEIAYSASPAMQTAAFRAAGLDWTYELVDVPPERLAGAVEAPRGPGDRAAHGTIP